MGLASDSILIITSQKINMYFGVRISASAEYFKHFKLNFIPRQVVVLVRVSSVRMECETRTACLQVNRLSEARIVCVCLINCRKCQRLIRS